MELDDSVIIICRCESVDLGELKHAIEELAARTLDDVKKATRIGMGVCQNRTCGPVVREILLHEMKSSVSGMKSRPPLRPVTLGSLREFTELIPVPDHSFGIEDLGFAGLTSKNGSGQVPPGRED